MSLIEWTNDLSVNVKEIDLQHQKLVEMINDLHAAMRDRKTKDSLKKIIDDLANYTASHFLTEEKYFDQFKYDKAFMHKKEHNDFVKKVMEFKKGFDENRLLLSMDIMNFLKDWLTKHIKGSDKQYSPFFNEKGLF